MKTITKIMMMTAVLLVVALTASAQGATRGTVKSSDKQMEMAYYFEGGKVTKQSSSAGRISYTYEVEEGATLKFYCKKVKGTDELRIVIDGKEAKGQSSASMTYQVPKGINRFSVWLEGTADYDLASAIDEDDGEISVGIECIVKNGSSSGNSTNSSSRLSSYKGTIWNLGTEMEYSLSGAIVTEKSNGEHLEGFVVYIKGQTEAGSTLSATFKKKLECKVRKKQDVKVSVSAVTTNGKSINLQEKSGKESATVSVKVPDNAKTISLTMEYKGGTGNIHNMVELEVVKKANAQENKSLKWEDASPAKRCPHCNGQFSNYYINPTHGFVCDAYIYCNNYKDERKKSARKVKSALDILYYNDFISTDDCATVVLDCCDEEETITIMQNTLVHLNKRTADGKDRWTVYKGRIVGKGIKHTDREFDMSSCTAKPTGTTYVLEDDGKTSRVYLLQGSMEVTSKKGSKKSTLKPGQAATVNNQGQMSVNSFDVAAMAKKYKISGVSTTTTTQDKDARYDVKCAVVKYKYTKGKETGQQERSFDNYGKLERRHFKSSSNETLMYIRDNKNYSLNVKKKTMTVTEDEQLNFKNTNDSRIKKTDKRKTATILGKTCTLYQTKSSDYWVWKGIVLKKVEHLKDGSTAITEATSITQPDSLDPKIFVVPKGYKTK